MEDFLSFEEKNSVSSRNLSISSAVSRRNSLQGGAKRIMNAHSSRTISNELNDRQVTAACTTSINTSLSSLNTLDELKNGAKEKSFSDGSLPNKSNQSISAVNDTVASDGSLFESSSEKYTGVSMEVFVFSADYLTKLSLDALWSNRKRAFEEIKRRIERAVTEKEVMHSSLFDVFIRLSLEHLSDSHIKVSLEAIDVIDECVKNCASQCRSHLAAIIVALFQKLGDKRGSIKDKANNILNLIRVSFEPTEIMSGLAPRLVDISEKFRTALMQFLGAIAPYCASYFQVAQNSWAFLGRLATILDSSTGKHVSITLLSAGRRLLELVYKASPDIICSQIFMLSFQQQIIIKKLLEILEPEINIKVAEAGKSAWNRPISEKNDAHASNKSDLDMRSIEEHVTSSDFQSEKNLKDSAARIKDDKRASLTDDISNNNGYLPYAPNKSPPSFQSPYRTVTCIASQKDLGLEVLAHSKINQIEQSQKCFPVNCAVDKTSTSWLLSALKISAKRCDRLEALEYVKRTAKTADEKYWQDNCSQVLQ